MHAVNAHGRIRLVVQVRVRSWVDGATPTADEGTDALGKAGREVGSGWVWRMRTSTLMWHQRQQPVSIVVVIRAVLALCFSRVSVEVETGMKWGENPETFREGSCYRIQVDCDESWKVYKKCGSF